MLLGEKVTLSVVSSLSKLKIPVWAVSSIDEAVTFKVQELWYWKAHKSYNQKMNNPLASEAVVLVDEHNVPL